MHVLWHAAVRFITRQKPAARKAVPAEKPADQTHLTATLWQRCDIDSEDVAHFTGLAYTADFIGDQYVVTATRSHDGTKTSEVVAQGLRYADAILHLIARDQVETRAVNAQGQKKWHHAKPVAGDGNVYALAKQVFPGEHLPPQPGFDPPTKPVRRHFFGRRSARTTALAR